MIIIATIPGIPISAASIAAFACVLVAIQVTSGWIVPQPNQNVWVILAKSLLQDNFCMAMGSMDDLLSTCLVGIPLSKNDYPL